MRTTFTLLLALVAIASCTENAGTAAINNAYLQTSFLNAVQDNEIALLQNPAMAQFYHQYYARPQETMSLQIADLNSRIQEHSKMAGGHYYPYANQISVDPNVIHRMANIAPKKRLVDRINDELVSLKRADANALAAQDRYRHIYSQPLDYNASMKTMQLRERMQNVNEAFHQNNLLKTQNHHYSVPFGANGPMNNVEKQVAKMEKTVQRPLAPLRPNAEEISALNLLSQKMEHVSMLIHKKPTEELHQSAHANDLLLEQLSRLIRRVSNSFQDHRQAYFLNGLHKLLHTYHLHDHKFLDSFEREIADALISNQALALPRGHAKPIQVDEPKPATDLDLNTPVTGKDLDLNTPVTHQAPAPALKPVPITDKMTAPPADVVKTPDLNTPVNTKVQTPTQTQTAKETSNELEIYGRRIVARSKAMEARADAHAVTPQAEHDDLIAAIMQRLNSPPAQVHAL